MSTSHHVPPQSGARALRILRSTVGSVGELSDAERARTLVAGSSSPSTARMAHLLARREDRGAERALRVRFREPVTTPEAAVRAVRDLARRAGERTAG